MANDEKISDNDATLFNHPPTDAPNHEQPNEKELNEIEAQIADITERIRVEREAINQAENTPKKGRGRLFNNLPAYEPILFPPPQPSVIFPQLIAGWFLAQILLFAVYTIGYLIYALCSIAYQAGNSLINTGPPPRKEEIKPQTKEEHQQSIKVLENELDNLLDKKDKLTGGEGEKAQGRFGQKPAGSAGG